MNPEKARKIVRECLTALCPDTDFNLVGYYEPLLERRLITSFQVIDLILHLEHRRGQPIQRSKLEPGSFRDIATIARIFLEEPA